MRRFVAIEARRRGFLFGCCQGERRNEASFPLRRVVGIQTGKGFAVGDAGFGKTGFFLESPDDFFSVLTEIAGAAFVVNITECGKALLHLRHVLVFVTRFQGLIGRGSGGGGRLCFGRRGGGLCFGRLGSGFFGRLRIGIDRFRGGCPDAFGCGG